MPLVSVNLVTYNHERCVGEAIRSVLRQTVSDLELVVVDDGSTDGTPRVVAGFDDPRVVPVRQENQGPGAATNRGLAACRGRYVALMTGDDVCHPDRLESQLEAHARTGGVVFSDVDYIDEEGRPLEECHFPKGFFDIPPMSQAEILRRFFDRGNFIHTVTTFAEAEVLRGTGPVDPLLYQLADYEWLLRLVKRHPFTFLRRPTLSYRVRAGAGNLGAPTSGRVLRHANDLYLVLRRFFDGVPPDLFREAFGDRFVCPDSRTPLELACEQAFLYARHPQFPPARLIGVERLHALMHDEAAAPVLRERFGLTAPRFADLLLHTNPYEQPAGDVTRLYVDTGAGFNSGESCPAPADHRREAFELTFDLAQFPPVRGLRWDPVELLHCRVWLDGVTWLDHLGGGHELDPALVGSNGWREADGGLSFRTADPMVYLAVTGDVSRVTLRGRWQVADSPTTAARFGAWLQEADSMLGRRNWEVQDLKRRLKECERRP
jgi:glycosyltransferase involved in cell wall biosynthesis